MPCYTPLTAYRAVGGGITFNRSEGTGTEIPLPCGQCFGCRLERSRQWAIRCIHEAQLHEKNSFITLTYNPENLPKSGSLDKTHFQKFMKRFRKEISPMKVRYYQCGEYGEKLSRPHYHAIIFGYGFPDQKFFKQENGKDLNTSEQLERLWGKGFCTVGDVTFKSAAYVSRYIMKKLNGDQSVGHYVNKQTGEILEKEYTTMSRRPGIGADWYKKYSTDVFPGDFVIISGKKLKVPSYYGSLLKEQDPDTYDKIKKTRQEKAVQLKTDNTPERLRVKEKTKRAQTRSLKRKLHTGTE